jgi:hypothetical protein
MDITEELLDQEVIVDWTNGDADWYWYIIQGVDDENGWFKMQGTTDEEGNIFTGPPIYVPWTEISCIERRYDFASGKNNGRHGLQV